MSISDNKFMLTCMVANEARGELENSYQEFPDFNTYHEGFAVLQEEVDELWEEIKVYNPDRDLISKEAKQVAAMAMKIMMLVEMETKDQDNGKS